MFKMISNKTSIEHRENDKEDNVGYGKEDNVDKF